MLLGRNGCAGFVHLRQMKREGWLPTPPLRTEAYGFVVSSVLTLAVGDRDVFRTARAVADAAAFRAQPERGVQVEVGLGFVGVMARTAGGRVRTQAAVELRIEHRADLTGRL